MIELNKELLLKGRENIEYLKDYNNLIDSARKRKTSEETCEKHCYSEAQVYLTTEEHIFAHILLYRAYPEQRGVIASVDIMLGLINSNINDREEVIKNLNLTDISKRRKKENKFKSGRIVCYSSVNYEVVKIYSNILDTDIDGFSTTDIAKLLKKGGGVSGSYSWMFFVEFEEKYPLALQNYLNCHDSLIEDLQTKYDEQDIDKIVCYKESEDFKVYRIYNKEVDCISDGFSSTIVSLLINGKKQGTHRGFNFTTLTNFQIQHNDKVSEFTGKPEIILVDEIKVRILCCDSNKNIIKIYNSLISCTEDGFSNTSLCRVLRSDNRFYNGYYWYRESEFENQDAIKNYVDSGVRVYKKETYKPETVVKVDGNGNIIDIYRNFHEVDDIDYRSISRVINRDPEKRILKGAYWYRISEYSQLHPDRLRDFLKVTNKVNTSMNKVVFRVMVTVSEKLISVNELYSAGIKYTGGGRPYAYMYKSAKAQNVSREVREQLKRVNIDEYLPWFKSTTAYDISIDFILKTGITRRDCSNFEKIMCDDFVKFIKEDNGVEHFDDSEFITCKFTKSLAPGSQNEFAIITLTNSTHDPILKLDDTFCFLGGELYPDYNWRKDLIPYLESNNIKYYNPAEDLWEQDKRIAYKFTKCNTYIQILPPTISSEDYIDLLWCISELSEIENKRLIFGILGTEEDWNNNMEYFEALTRLMNMYDSKLQGNVKFVLINNIGDFIKYIS